MEHPYSTKELGSQEKLMMLCTKANLIMWFLWVK